MLSLGYTVTEMDKAVWLPENVDELRSVVEVEQVPLTGAYVPLVLTQPERAEVSYDTAEFAADVLAGENAQFLVVAPFVDPDLVKVEGSEAMEVSVREWNHAIAMLARLNRMCDSRSLHMVIRGNPASMYHHPDLGPEQRVHYVLDVGELGYEGFVPMCISPSPELA